MKIIQVIKNVALLAFALSAGCSNEDIISLDGTADATMPLAIDVSNSLGTRVGGVISGSKFANGVSLGLYLTKEDGSSAYDKPYNNIQYTSAASGSNQVWSATSPILLTPTKAKLFAYYPYNSSYTNISAIPINVTENKDVMWATPNTGIYNANRSVTLQMNHALSVVNLSLKKGDYSGTGTIESISIQGACMAKTGKLNAKTGALTIADAGAEIALGSLGSAATLSTTAKNVQQLVIPTPTSGQIKVTIKLDGKTYTTTTTASQTLKASQSYTLNLTVNDAKTVISDVQIGDWTMSGSGNEIITAGGYKISFEGDCDNVGFSLPSESNGTVVINTFAPLGYYPYPVTISAGASLNQTINNNVRTLVISSIIADITITMKGVVLNDGVYAIMSDGSLMAYSEAKTTSETFAGVAIMVSGKAYQISNTGLSGIKWAHPNPGDIEGLNNYTTADGTNSSGRLGYDLNTDHTIWTTTTGALSDFDGKGNTEKIIAAQTGKTSSKDFIGIATVDFRKGSNNQSYTDWYVPACGQLAYVALHLDEINTLFEKIGATQLPTDDYHWSSSERAKGYALILEFRSLYVGGTAKGTSSDDTRHYVRFLRDITVTY